MYDSNGLYRSNVSVVSQDESNVREEICLSLAIDAILVPQGAEFATVQRACRSGLPIFAIPGGAAVAEYLATAVRLCHTPRTRSVQCYAPTLRLGENI